ncbi:MAG: amidohydrolase family protein, partial [bacterium]
AMLVARGRGGPQAMSARDAIRVATRGSARCLGRDDIGSLESGKRADIALFDVTGLGSAGTEADPIASLVFTPPSRVRHLMVEGRWVVQDGRLVNADEEEISVQARQAGRRIAAASTRTRATPRT